MSSLQSLIDKHFPAGFSVRAGETLETPAVDQSNRAAMDARRDAVGDVVRAFLLDMAADGHLTANTNAEGHKVRWVIAWNDLVAGKPLDIYGNMYLRGAPALQAADKAIISPLYGLDDFKTKPFVRKAITVGEGEDQLRAVLMNTMDDIDFKMGIETFKSPMTGEPFLHDFSDLYAPVVQTIHHTPAEPFTAPKGVRHVVMPMPSGKLIMADRIRVPGLTEMTRRAERGENEYSPEIDSAAGTDEVSRRTFEDLGLLYIMVSNRSPAAFVEGDIIRMGSVDEDAAMDDNVQNPPSASWSTCTDRWSNEFCDLEVMLDILEASGAYADRAAAETAVLAYVDETYGANIIDIGPGDLHVYMPTGAHKKLPDTFSAAEVARADWRRDTYILSRAPLTVDPDIVDEPGWTAGTPRPLVESPSPAL